MRILNPNAHASRAGQFGDGIIPWRDLVTCRDEAKARSVYQSMLARNCIVRVLLVAPVIWPNVVEVGLEFAMSKKG